MTCPTERLAAAFPSLPADLEGHVAGCAACADAWGGYRALADLVNALPEPEPPTALEVRRARRALVASARLRAACADGQQEPGRGGRRPRSDRVGRLEGAVRRRDPAPRLGPDGAAGPDRAPRRDRERPDRAPRRLDVAWADRAARRDRERSDRAPRRLAGLAAAAVLVAGGTLLSSPLGPRREVRVADAPQGGDPAPGASARDQGAPGDPVPGRLTPRSPAAPPEPRSGGVAVDPAPGTAPWTPEAETWPESIQAPDPRDGEGRRLTLHELRERWSFVGIAPPAVAGSGVRPAPRTAAPLDRRAGSDAVASGRLGLSGLPGRPSGPGSDGTGGDSPTSGAGARGADPSPGGGDRPDDPDGEAPCGDVLADRFTECLIASGLDPAHPDESEEASAIASACWQDAAAAAEACCAGSPDAFCEETRDRGGASCADVLFAENDRCLADSEIEDPTNPVTEADIAIVSYCWIDVANGAFDACCAETPDPTCQ